MTQSLQSNPSEPLFRASRIDYSRAGEALTIADLLPAAGPRFLVDIDAGDGMSWSLSRGLIDDGWSALLLEESPLHFESLRQKLSGFPCVCCLNAHGGGSSLGPLFSRHNVPADFQLLIINSAESAPDILACLDPGQHHPRVIVMNDQQAAEARTSTYRTLNRHGYSYAGMAGTSSLWSTEALGTRSHPPLPSAALPPLPEAPSALALVDYAPGALGSSGVAGNQTYLINGWAFVESSPVVPPLVYVEVRNHRTGLTDYFEAHRCRRPDVSQHFGRPELEMSGFRALITLNNRMAGEMSLGVMQMDATNRYPSAAEISVQRTLEEYEQNPRLGMAKKILRGTGIEIGALQKALPLPDSCKVRYVDRMALTDLLHHYPELRGLPLQAPDIVDNGEQLSTIASGSQDFVIANHFLEHCQNPFHTLANFLRVLRTGGVLFMAVPDKRFTFDFDRPCTEYVTLRDAYNAGVRANRAELYREWAEKVERCSGHDAGMRAAQLEASDYSIHYNVWTVDVLLTHILQARSEFQLAFRLLSVVCADNEVISLIEKTAS